MKYLLLAYGKENRLAAMLPGEHATYEAAGLTTTERLRASGHLRVAARLHDLHVATTVQVRTGQITVTAGSLVETSELFTELFVIEARDLNEAIRVAAQLPQTRDGSIEVRPLTAFDAS